MNSHDRCFMLVRPFEGGGNFRVTNGHVTIRRNLAIGDAVCATAVADKLIEAGHPVVFQTNPEIGQIIVRHPTISRVEAPSGRVDVDLDGAYEKDPQRKLRHFADMFFEVANRQLAARSINVGPAVNYRVRLKVREEEKRAMQERLSRFEPPWVFVCPRSNTYFCRTVPDDIWEAAAKQIKGTCFWIGIWDAPPALVDLRARTMAALPVMLSAADMLVTVDTGPMHIAAALGIPIVAIYQSSSPELHLSDQVDFDCVKPDLDCLNCQKNICPIKPYEPPCQEIDPVLIAGKVNARLQGRGVSAVIPVYRPPAERLNRCLEAVLPQVDEVIVARDAHGVFPAGSKHDAKIRYVATYRDDIGYGRKANFAARHATQPFLLFVNDDVYLAPDAVARLRQSMTERVALVGQLLRYPDGRIYHGGVTRALGTLDWGHIDHNRFEPTITAPCELEQVTGACVLVRRKAFFDVAGFDERFYLYCEDNDLCMKLRQAGWKVWYTPLATGIHEGSATTRDMPNLTPVMHASQKLFHEKWDWYLRKNINNTLGNF